MWCDAVTRGEASQYEGLIKSDGHRGRIRKRETETDVENVDACNEAAVAVGDGPAVAECAEHEAIESNA